MVRFSANGRRIGRPPGSGKKQQAAALPNADLFASASSDDRHALAPDCMADVGRRLTTDDVNAVASWLAVQPGPDRAKPAAALPGPLPMPCSAMPASAAK